MSISRTLPSDVCTPCSVRRSIGVSFTSGRLGFVITFTQDSVKLGQ
jgi:hypothetical protein